MKLTIFGPNLRDQSKGTFVVHAAGCADCGKLKNEIQHTDEFATATAAASFMYDDQIKEGSMTPADALKDFHFAPCCKHLPN